MELITASKIHLIFICQPSVQINGSQSTVFGVSCFKQIDSKELKNKMDDVTRSTVQKSVCVLSYLPLYGYLKVKIQVATRVYFNEKDFARTEILEQLYRSLNMSVSPSLMEESLLFVGYVSWFPCWKSVYSASLTGLYLSKNASKWIGICCSKRE
ncbi:late secretory pathway protein AVL9 homolog [Acropora muricata]|uniref:late secretory pathway protein AVL9 homolog n=1 Tax=Acropora muricata TaxID=159855 RepID=UPI0034E510B4